MSITFNSTGGFLNGTISSSGNNIFIQTSGSAGAIHLGTQLELTGSKVIEKDGDGNKRLTFQEFLQVFLPCEDNLLRNMTLDRPSRRVARFEFLPRDIEIAMTTVIEKEVELQRKLEVLKRDL